MPDQQVKVIDVDNEALLVAVLYKTGQMVVNTDMPPAHASQILHAVASQIAKEQPVQDRTAIFEPNPAAPPPAPAALPPQSPELDAKVRRLANKWNGRSATQPYAKALYELLASQ